VTHDSRDVLETTYDAFAKGDIDTATASFADDIDWRVNGPSPVAGTYTGKDAVLGFFPRMMALYEGTLRVEVTAMLADEHHGFVWVTESADRPGEVAYTGVHVWSFRDGRCTRFESYYDDTYADFWSAWFESP
jgi:ketosteroid isomerase-like protein